MIVAVIVAYNPNLPLLERSFQSLLEQVDYLIVVDNSPQSMLSSNGKVSVERLGCNIGIAAAQNIGIRKAIEFGAEYILLSDQDTVYPDNYVSAMLPVFGLFPSACVIVPRFMDVIKKGADGFYLDRPVLFKKFYPLSGKHKVFQAIASGKVLKVSSLDKIGLMNEDLFIDWVDFEWCWRARSKGFEIVGNADVVIQHLLGDVSKDLGFREVNLRSPARHYYITRNAFYLALYSRDLDLGHRVNLFFKSFRYIVGFPLLARPFSENFKAVLAGFWHGITARLGKFEFK